MTRDNRKFPSSKSRQLLQKERYQYINPVTIFNEIGLKPGMRVADLGCGNGFFSLPAAEYVGQEGVVHATDVSEVMLNKLRQRLTPGNLIVSLSTEYNFPIETDSVDFALAAIVIHEVDNYHKFLLEVRRILKEEGYLWILEWEPVEEEKGPPQQHRISKKELTKYLTLAGFRVVWIKPAGDSHYQILAEKMRVSCSC
jgi:ubiquinone/menaquinone biosynthesis C-methylase UbiE